MTDEVPKGSEPETSESLKAFGEVVKAFRRRAGLTQEQFAPLVGYSVPMIASIEQGRRPPSKEFVNRAEEVRAARKRWKTYALGAAAVAALLSTTACGRCGATPRPR